MHDLGRKGRVGYEDLMHELAVIEHQLLKENGSAAMALMVLEAKLRDRFQQLEYRVIEKDPSYHNFPFFDPELPLEDMEDLIPQELPQFPTIEDIEAEQKKTWKTVATAAVLALVTAVGVFTVASLLQFALTWFA